MKRFLLTGLLSASLMTIGQISGAQGLIFGDTDWNTAFAESCGLPRQNSIERITLGGDRKLRFTLEPGDIGKCSTDNRSRHRAPYWERAEVSQMTNFNIGHRYRMSAEVTFVSGFVGDRETFFQIHGWAHDCTKAYPPVMVKFKKGKLAIETLRGASGVHPGNHRNALRKNVRVSTLYDRQLAFVVDFDTGTRPGKLSVSLGGAQLVTDAPVTFAPCAVPHVKFGIYRPGGKGSQRSVVVFDDLQFNRIQ